MDTPQAPEQDAILALYLRRDIDATPLDAPEDQRLLLPLASQIEGNLYQGGTPATVGLVPAHFKFVLNLYPWESYMRHDGTEVRVAPLHDDDAGVPARKIEELAAWVNEKRALGPTLVHCQLGLNRSGLVNALALMQAGRTADEAIALLREQRSPAVLFNPTFEHWLRSR